MSQLMDEPITPAPNRLPVKPAALAEQWLEMFGDRLYAYALRRVRHSHLAEDLVQETLLAALKSSSKFENRSAASTWLTGILKNKIADHFRKRHAQSGANTGAEESIPEEQALFDKRGRWRSRGTEWRGDPQRIAESQEFQSVLQSCLGKLPTTTTQVFVSRVVDGVETPELCKQLEITPGYAWTLLHRARLGLRECLTRNWFLEASEKKE